MPKSKNQLDFEAFLTGWLRKKYDCRTLIGGRFLPISEWVKGRKVQVYIRFQYKAVNGKSRACAVLANINSWERGTASVVIGTMMRFCEETGLVFYIENCINPVMDHLAIKFGMSPVDAHTELGLPCYYKRYDSEMENPFT